MDTLIGFASSNPTMAIEVVVILALLIVYFVLRTVRHIISAIIWVALTVFSALTAYTAYMSNDFQKLGIAVVFTVVFAILSKKQIFKLL